MQAHMSTCLPAIRRTRAALVTGRHAASSLARTGPLAPPAQAAPRSHAARSRRKLQSHTVASVLDPRAVLPSECRPLDT